MENAVTKREKISYGMYFMGQNVFYGLVDFMTTYFTDVGIAAAMVALIALITKVWDAVNDPIFGAVMDKMKFRKGKFLPWLRLSVIVLPLSTILIFAIPGSLPLWVKMAWATVSYMLWNLAYTISDAPIFGIVTTMTTDQGERISLNNVGRFFAMIAGIVIAIVIPLFRQALGGWTITVVLLSLIAIATMLPICLFVKERVIEMENAQGEQENYHLKDMVECLRKNKYLLIYFSAYIVSSMLNIGSAWSLYIARYCLGGEERASAVTVVSIAPMILAAVITPVLCRKFDKFKIFKGTLIAGLIISVIRFFAGYHNFIVYLVISAVGSFSSGIVVMLMYQFTPDCYEYGQYKTGLKMRGVTFAAQTFFMKLSSALATACSMFVLTLIGLVAGENAVQMAGFDQKLLGRHYWYSSTSGYPAFL